MPHACRPVRHPWRGHGEALLPQVHGRLHPQILPTPSHRRSLFRDGFPPHAVHGAPRVPAKAAGQPVCPKVRLPVCGVHFKLHSFTFIVAPFWKLCALLALLQAVRLQNSPDGLPAPTPGRIEFQEPSEDDSLT